MADAAASAEVVELQNLLKYVNTRAVDVIALLDGSRRRLLKQQLEAAHHAMKIVLDAIEAEARKKR